LTPSPANAPKKTYRPVLILALGDLIALLLFVGLGRRSHALSLTDLSATLATTLPFLAAWFLVSPWFGLFRAGISQNWRRLLPRLLLAWVVIGCPLALILRALWLGRAIPGGIPLTFALVTLAVTTLFLLIWRLGYALWAARHHPRPQDHTS
jgi:hypothetical protein